MNHSRVQHWCGMGGGGVGWWWWHGVAPAASKPLCLLCLKESCSVVRLVMW